MPLKKGKKNVSANIRELYADNKKSGKAKGANGKTRKPDQIVAIAMRMAGMKKKWTKTKLNKNRCVERKLLSLRWLKKWGGWNDYSTRVYW